MNFIDRKNFPAYFALKNFIPAPAIKSRPNSYQSKPQLMFRSDNIFQPAAVLSSNRHYRISQELIFVKERYLWLKVTSNTNLLPF
jgi:hypothetical protein